MRGAATNPEQDDRHLPVPTRWPVGFAIGVACIIAGLLVNWWAAAAGVVIAAVFGALWLRALTTPRGEQAVQAPGGDETAPEFPAGERFPRSKFLEGATLGLGAVVGGAVTIPPLGLAVLPALLGGERDEVDVGPITDYPVGEFVITTFVSDLDAGEVSRRTVFIRNNGLLRGEPSFTILSNRCVHLGCPVQANGPVEEGTRLVDDRGIEILLRVPVKAAGFGCPCHGGAYDNEGNRTAGPPVRPLDRYTYAIRNGSLVLRKLYSVSEVEGTGKDAQIKKHSLHAPGQHVEGPEAWLWPIPELK